MRDLRHLETRQNLGRSWYDYSWDWALASLFALVLLTGIASLAAGQSGEEVRDNGLKC
jgi:hypothetical protein